MRILFWLALLLWMRALAKIARGESLTVVGVVLLAIVSLPFI